MIQPIGDKNNELERLSALEADLVDREFDLVETLCCNRAALDAVIIQIRELEKVIEG